MFKIIVAVTVFALTTISISHVKADDDLRARNDAIIVRAIERMDNYDFRNDQHVVAALSRHLNRVAGTQEYLDLAKKFRPDGMESQLLELVVSGPNDNVKSDAAELLLQTKNGAEMISALLHSEDQANASKVCQTLGLLGNEPARSLLNKLVQSPDTSFETRKQALVGLAKNGAGQNAILQLVTDNQFPSEMRLLAGGLLARSNNENVRERASRLLPQPQQKNAAPLAPIDQLAGMKGDIAAGKKLFEGVATCSNCHIINRIGKEVGPDLSEIGSKLSREAMYTAILDPSAGISHNYENFSVLTLDGQVISGLKVSDSDKEVVIRTAEAIDRRIPQDEIELVKKSEKSIMPENLHHAFDQQGLINLVEYMASLTKK
ncbi:MAG: hypothetical protein ACON4H_10580 [Rubripirellula sp.]